jgi:prepilin-type N-terminal cleavage/methylation domain-containing protein
MKRPRKQQGFTIIETLIVLTISAGLFASAALLVGGEQNKVAFTQGINQIQQQIQQTINQTSSGYYVNAGFSCTASGTGPNIASGADGQGTNKGCVFLGKAMEFALHDTGGASSAQQYRIIPIAGLRKNDGTLADAQPTAIAPGSGVTHNVPDDSRTEGLHNGIHAVWMRYGSHNIGALAFIGSLGGGTSASGMFSGAQHLDVYPVPESASYIGSKFVTYEKNVVDKINSQLAGATKDPSGGIQICFASGTTDQSGLVTIGGNARALSVTDKIMDGKTCS